MSRIGLKTIELPEGVEVKIDGNDVTVKGPKGQLTRTLHGDMVIKVEGNTVNVERPHDLKVTRSLHGTTRSLIANMVDGVSKGFETKLENIVVGYRAQKQANEVLLSARYSHPVEIDPPDCIKIEFTKNTELIVIGIDKKLVGAVAANIRSIRLPEPYKGKGIRYADEYVR